VKKCEKNTGVWLGAVAIVIAVVALCVAICRSEPITYDYMGVLVGVLAVLVTALITWQIYTLVDINKKAKELSRLTMETALGTERSLALSEDAAAGIYSYLLLKEDPLGLEYQILWHRISSLLHTSNFDDIETCNAMVKASLEMIVNPSKISMIQSCKDRLLFLLTKVGHTDKIVGYSELVEKIAKINVVPRQAQTQHD
jgi:hypothetical protein